MAVDDLEPFYESFRLGESPSAQQEAETWSAIARRLEQGAQGPILEDDAPEPSATTGRWRGGVLVLGAIAAAALIVTVATMSEPRVADLLERPLAGGAASFDVNATRAHDVVERRRRVPRAGPRASPAGVEPPPVSTTEPPTTPVVSAPVPSREPASLEPPTRATPSPRRRPRPRRLEPEPRAARPEPAPRPAPRSAPRSAPGPATAVPSIEPEVQLLEDAKRALAVGRPDRALALLRDHRRRFESGMLSPERDVLEVRALCAVGREPLARRRATEAARANPNSPWASTLRRVCADALER